MPVLHLWTRERRCDAFICHCVCSRALRSTYVTQTVSDSHCGKMDDEEESSDMGSGFDRDETWQVFFFQVPEKSTFPGKTSSLLFMGGKHKEMHR